MGMKGSKAQAWGVGVPRGASPESAVLEAQAFESAFLKAEASLRGWLPRTLEAQAEDRRHVIDSPQALGEMD